MRLQAALRDVIVADPIRWAALATVRALDLPDGWIGAGFVRDAIWDHLHGHPPQSPAGDVDVIWFDCACTDTATDRSIEALLATRHPDLRWSVKNQARMHLRNGDAPYRSVADAMRAWPETATAVAVSRTRRDRLEITAPFGLSDLFSLRLRPTARFRTEKRAIFDQRIEDKQWTARYPRLVVAG